MDIKEKATIIHYHRHRMKEYSGDAVRSLGWKEAKSQRKRFEVLAGLADLNGCSVMDLGCGHGDLRGYLEGRYSNFVYIGIEQVPEFVEEANRRYGQLENTFFYQTDFETATLPEVQYVFASGALGYRCDDPSFYRQMIAKMYASASKALAFNMLDANVFPEHPLLVGHDPDRIEAFCKELSPNVRVIKGYLEDDFTVFMYRE